VSLTQGMDGSIQATQTMTQYGDDGTNAAVYTDTGIIVQPPIATDSSTTAGAPVTTGPATTTLSPGGQSVTLTVDPAWLHAAGRAFPVTLDLPIATGYAALHTGVFGTVSSCAPNAPAPPAEVVVGVANGCTYHGLTSFDLSSVSANTTVNSATLWLYTPNTTGPTSVQVEANVASANDPYQWPSWNSAPAIVTTTAPLAQSGGSGHWQSWNVTNLVQQWVQDGSTNGGLTLVSTGAPVTFASALGAGKDDPSVEPYLEVTYGSGAGATTAGVTANAVTAASSTYNSPSNPYYDTAPFIYGEAGSYTADSPSVSGGLNVLPSEATNCSANGITCGQGQFRLSAAHHNIGAQYIRFNVQLACASYQAYGINPTAPGPAWWNTSPAHPLNTSAGPANAVPNNIGDALELLAGSHGYHLIPIVVFIGNGQCTGDMTPTLWQNQVKDFVSSYLQGYVGYPTSAPIYFEVGNEPNLASPKKGAGPFSGNVPLYTNDPQGFYGNTPGTYHFPAVFAYAARGMFAPSANRDPTMCNGQNSFDFYDDVFAAGQAINAAINSTAQIPGPVVPQSHLGVAVHPYGYDLPPTGPNFRNYYGMPDSSLSAGQKQQVYGYSSCLDILGVINRWSGSDSYTGHNPAFVGVRYDFTKLPVFFTEINYVAGAVASADHNVAEGAYLADLFTFLYNLDCSRGRDGRCTSLGIDPSMTRLRVAWDRGVDGPGADDLGLYTGTGGDKDVGLRYCANNPALRPSRNNPRATHSLAYDYYYLRNGSCYAYPTRP